MGTLEQLMVEMAETEKRIRTIAEEIARHPESIWTYFSSLREGGLVDAIVDQVEYVKDASGWTPDRKNAMEWRGYSYKFKGEDKTYWCRQADNWCHSFQDCGEYGDERSKDMDQPCAVWEELDCDDARYIAKALTLHRHEALAYLLWLQEGW